MGSQYVPLIFKSGTDPSIAVAFLVGDQKQGGEKVAGVVCMERCHFAAATNAGVAVCYQECVLPVGQFDQIRLGH